MPSLRTLARLTLAGLALAEGTFALKRWQARRDAFEAATRRAALLQRPLVVVGDPDAGAHTRLYRAYGCGDLCVDLHGCPLCPVVQVADISAGQIPGLADNSAVVFVSCVLEYVEDAPAAARELLRITGTPENLFLVAVQPWTFTASLYPGARWTVIRHDHELSLTAIPAEQKTLSCIAVGGLAFFSS